VRTILSSRNIPSPFLSGSCVKNVFLLIHSRSHHRQYHGATKGSIVRSCISRNSRNTQRNNTDFHINFLGTAGNAPSKARNFPSTVLKLGSQDFIFDVGEGTQRQFHYTTLSPLRTKKIFITHMHGDHVLGLIGVILQIDQLNMSASGNENTAVEVYGPPGLYMFIKSNLKFLESRLTLDVIVTELVGGKVRSSSTWTPPKDHMFSNSSVKRREIYPTDDGTWVLNEPAPATREMIAKDTRRKNACNDGMAGRRRGFHIHAAEIRHLPGLPTFGYSVREMDPPQNIDVNKAISLGVKPGKKYNLLKNGFNVLSDDEMSEVRPKDVIVEGHIRARKLVVLGDNCGVSSAMKTLSQGADVVINEATLSTEKAEHAFTRGHSTPAMCGRLAKEVGAKVLAVNHVSVTYFNTDELQQFMKEVQEPCLGATLALASCDFMEIAVPRGGIKSTDLKLIADDIRNFSHKR